MIRIYNINKREVFIIINTEEKEIWKPIPSLDNMYEASNLGRIRSLPRVAYSPRGNGYYFSTKGTLLKPTLMGSGIRYPYVRITTEKYNKPMPVHRFVAEVFLGEIPDKMVINHIDGNTNNNNVSNLEIVTYHDNAIHSREVLKTIRGYSTCQLKITNVETNEFKVYKDGVAASADLGVLLRKYQVICKRNLERFIS